MSDEFPFKVGDRVRATGTVLATNTPYRWMMVSFDGATACIGTDAKVDLENLGSADPANWPPQVGDIWEADGREYYVRQNRQTRSSVTVAAFEDSVTHDDFAEEQDKFKALNPRLVRRRESSGSIMESDTSFHWPAWCPHGDGYHKATDADLAAAQGRAEEMGSYERQREVQEAIHTRIERKES